jgi:hypothetical protein
MAMTATGRLCFCLFLAFPAAAGAQPPQFVQIVREEVRPLALERYGKIETEIARICAARKCPHPYLALQAEGRPTEVWWLNSYDTRSELNRVPGAYAHNRQLIAALLPLSDAKKQLAHISVSVVLRFATGAADWRIGRDPFAVVFGDPSSKGTCFRGGKDTYCFAAAPDEKMARKIARNARATILKVNPRWSYGFAASVNSARPATNPPPAISACDAAPNAPCR